MEMMGMCLLPCMGHPNFLGLGYSSLRQLFFGCFFGQSFLKLSIFLGECVPTGASDIPICTVAGELAAVYAGSSLMTWLKAL
jgi:hypothetical protein